MNPATLALEDGTVFEGSSFGAQTDKTGEVVFNTAITGYQEIFTDPSYAGQIVVLTYPEIGNYGANGYDKESFKPFIEGLVVREFSSIASNWRSEQSADRFLAENDVPVAAEIDTRALVRHLRNRGVMRGILATGKRDPKELVELARQSPSMTGLDLATRVTTASRYEWDKPVTPCSPSDQMAAPAKPCCRVVAYDYGIKRNILRRLVQVGAHVTVVPASTTAEDVLALNPDGIFLSNGPGDPEPCTYAVDNIRRLMGRQPIFGICLGHQLTGIALGGKTFKLKFGHHGGNHPVKQLQSGKVEITAHNHNFAVDPDSLPQSEVELTHMDLNDQTLEGMRHRNLPLFSVQYHPEAAPGPHDSHYLFKDFVKMMEEWKR